MEHEIVDSIEHPVDENRWLHLCKCGAKVEDYEWEDHIKDEERMMDEVVKENARLVNRNIELEKTITANKERIEGFIKTCKEWKRECDLANEESQELQTKLSADKEKIVHLKACLDVRKEKQTATEDEVESLRKALEPFVDNYKTMNSPSEGVKCFNWYGGGNLTHEHFETAEQALTDSSGKGE